MAKPRADSRIAHRTLNRLLSVCRMNPRNIASSQIEAMTTIPMIVSTSSRGWDGNINSAYRLLRVFRKDSGMGKIDSTRALMRKEQMRRGMDMRRTRRMVQGLIPRR